VVGAALVVAGTAGAVTVDNGLVTAGVVVEGAVTEGAGAAGVVDAVELQPTTTETQINRTTRGIKAFFMLTSYYFEIFAREANQSQR
jgi:ABC-type cobalamin transport system permease subunit